MEQFFKPIHLACADDELRPDMSIIKIKNGVATATNGSLLVRVELSQTSSLDHTQLSLLEGKHIHMETFKEMHKCDSLTVYSECVDVYKNGIKKTLYFMDQQSQLWDESKIVDDIRNAGIEKKLNINMSRTWRKNPDNTYSHTK